MKYTCNETITCNIYAKNFTTVEKYKNFYVLRKKTWLKKNNKR